ncbi:hypothetical protein SANTM175S_01515 [Streptomyces antimycoticus]
MPGRADPRGFRRPHRGRRPASRPWPRPSTRPGLTHLSPGEETSAEARLTLVPATLAKGLEYDYVVLDEPAAVVDGEPDERTGLRRLYVSLTRAVSGLTVVHGAALPERLS